MNQRPKIDFLGRFNQRLHSCAIEFRCGLDRDFGGGALLEGLELVEGEAAEEAEVIGGDAFGEHFDAPGLVGLVDRGGQSLGGEQILGEGVPEGLEFGDGD